VLSLCTSAFVLAAAGLLNGLSATTHWGLCDEFARRFPDIHVDPSVLFVDNGGVLTSAGAAAGIDMCLHLVRRDYGTQVANATARRCVVALYGGRPRATGEVITASGSRVAQHPETGGFRDQQDRRLQRPAWTRLRSRLLREGTAQHLDLRMLRERMFMQLAHCARK